MALPESVRDEVEAALNSSGLGTRVSESVPVSGGCINNGARLTTDGAHYFLKWNASAPLGLFEAEVEGLDALRVPGTLRVPEPLATGGGLEGAAWLLMEYLAPASATPDSDERLGRGLAAVHDAPPHELGVGWEKNNWIGSLEQQNAPTEGWSAFWRDRRIAPQLTLARAAGRLPGPKWDHLLDVIPVALDDDIRPALLHGDLWNGNVYVTTGGEPVVIDPAVYRGDGEVDLAMSELFGGFGRSFYDAYHEARPISTEYRSHRRDLYQLFYLLVHVNLFGTSYVPGAEATATRVLAALS
jgi:fructosamine-3-kinase